MTLHEEVSQQINKNKKLVDLGEAIERLMLNKDFQKVILENYFVANNLAIVKDLSNHLKSSNEYAKLIAQLDAISECQSYLFGLQEKYLMAKQDLSDAMSLTDEEITNNDY